MAAGTRRRITLTDVEVLPWLCCMAPAFITFGLFGAVTFSALFAPIIFYWLTAYLTVASLAWVFAASFFAFVSYLRVRQATKQDWQAMLEEVQQVDPDGSSVLHIVILPNYNESERMFKETIENLGRSPLASTRVRIVLGMEAREGPAAHEKANRLIQQTQHLFADIMATYHPEGLPGEIPGKSSNTQWAYREALRHYGPILLGYDLSRVFVTIGDADTLWHPQYLSALTYSGLMMSEEERIWRIWQPPVILARNHFSVPVMTRNSGYATIIFEMFGLSAPKAIVPAFAYSTYSLTLALASHPEVDGWDPDVIAEDHHMFCKCFFAALWELAHAAKDASKQKNAENVEPVVIEPQLKVEPIFLPAVGYLVESNEGYWASVWVRFVQARRHIQGVVELGYVLLQYARLTSSTGWNNIPKTTHAAIIAIALKMYVLAIQTNVQCWSIVMAALTKIVPPLLYQIWSNGFSLHLVLGQNVSIGSIWQALDSTQQMLITALSHITGLTALMAAICALVLVDLKCGRFYSVLPPVPPVALSVAEGDDDDDTHASGSEQASSPTGPPLHNGLSPPRGREAESDNGKPVRQEMPSFVQGELSFLRKLGFATQVLVDFSTAGYTSMFFYSMIPLFLAAWSLFVRGTDFEYIVACKPE